MVVRGMFCPGAPIFSTKYKHCASKKVIIIIHNNWHVFNELQGGGGYDTYTCILLFSV